MDYVMRRRSTVGGALEMFSLPLPLHVKLTNNKLAEYRIHSFMLCVNCDALLVIALHIDNK